MAEVGCTEDEGFCAMCGWPPQACRCVEELNGDTSEPIPDGSLAEMLEDLEYEEEP
jgi:hypothetical protein